MYRHILVLFLTITSLTVYATPSFVRTFGNHAMTCLSYTHGLEAFPFSNMVIGVTGFALGSVEITYLSDTASQIQRLNTITADYCSPLLTNQTASTQYRQRILGLTSVCDDFQKEVNRISESSAFYACPAAMTSLVLQLLAQVAWLRFLVPNQDNQLGFRNHLETASAILTTTSILSHATTTILAAVQSTQISNLQNSALQGSSTAVDEQLMNTFQAANKGTTLAISSFIFFVANTLGWYFGLYRQLPPGLPR